jgi:predicted esterase
VIELAGAALTTARRAVVVVHGRDQSPAYMLEHLVEPLGLPDTAYVLPGADGGSWYPGRYHDPKAANEPWLSAALDAIGTALRTLDEAGVEAGRIVLAGFSQGACLVCEHVARFPARYAGIALLTGCAIGPPAEQVPPPIALRDVPVYLGTREDDGWIPAADVRATAAAFSRAGARVSLDVRQPGPHQIDPEDVIAVRALLA